jgi:DNA-binding LytR/AlgR family response regulator
METIELCDVKSRRRVAVSAIEYCVGDGNYTFVYLKGERPVLIAKTLLRFAEQLPGFIRIHKGTLVNPLHIIGHFPHKGMLLVRLSGQRSLPVARRRAAECKQQLITLV